MVTQSSNVYTQRDGESTWRCNKKLPTEKYIELRHYLIFHAVVQSHLSSYRNKPQAMHALGSCQRTPQTGWKSSAGRINGPGTGHADHYTWPEHPNRPRTTFLPFLSSRESKCLLPTQKEALPFGLWAANPFFVFSEDSLEQPGGCCWLAPAPSWCSAAACSPLLHPLLTYSTPQTPHQRSKRWKSWLLLNSFGDLTPDSCLHLQPTRYSTGKP